MRLALKTEPVAAPPEKRSGWKASDGGQRAYLGKASGWCYLCGSEHAIGEAHARPTGYVWNEVARRYEQET